MFKKLEYNYSSKDSGYFLVDSNFTVKLDPKLPLLASIMQVYLERKQPVAKNIALYYLWFNGTQYIVDNFSYVCSSIKNISNYYDEDYPYLKFGNRYYNCIINHVKQLISHKRY